MNFCEVGQGFRGVRIGRLYLRWNLWLPTHNMPPRYKPSFELALTSHTKAVYLGYFAFYWSWT